jgi:hypothetical protein
MRIQALRESIRTRAARRRMLHGVAAGLVVSLTIGAAYLAPRVIF